MHEKDDRRPLLTGVGSPALTETQGGYSWCCTPCPLAAVSAHAEPEVRRVGDGCSSPA